MPVKYYSGSQFDSDEPIPENLQCSHLIAEIRRQLLAFTTFIIVGSTASLVVALKVALSLDSLLSMVAVLAVWSVILMYGSTKLADNIGCRFQQLLSIISEFVHEIASPIAGIRTNLAEGPDGSDVFGPQRLKALRIACRRMISLNEDLRVIATWGSPVRHNTLTLVRPAQIAEVCVEELKSRFGKLGIEVKLHVETSQTLVCDGEALKRVFLNLLDNAAKYCPRGSEVKFHISEASGKFTISISDNGEGIPPAVLARVFERNYRGESENTKGTKGMGLGLAIAKQIVESHGGKIIAKQVEPHGVEFQITLLRVPNQHPSAQIFRQFSRE